MYIKIATVFFFHVSAHYLSTISQIRNILSVHVNTAVTILLTPNRILNVM